MNRTNIFRRLARGSRRLGPVAALALAVVFSTGMLRGQSSNRAKMLGAKMLCMCSCGQGLTACNHVGCTKSGAMLKEIDQRIASGDSDDLILQSFVQEYGEQVLAEPPAHGFNALAWAIPGIAFAVGLTLVVLVIRAWWHPAKAAVPAQTAAARAAISPEMLERARRQADRETDD